MNQKIIATHNGSHHADDAFGVAILSKLRQDHSVVRTRDPEIIKASAYVIDVGGEWVPEQGRFDHHQRGFEGARPVYDVEGNKIEGRNGVAYASAGLIWEEFGSEYIRFVVPQLQDGALGAQRVMEIWRTVDGSLVQHIDLEDTGKSKSAEGLFGFSAQIEQLNLSWLEEQGKDHATVEAMAFDRFQQAMAYATALVDRIIHKRFAQQEAAALVRASERLLDGRVLHLAGGGMPWTKVVLEEMPDVLYVLYPERSDAKYMIKCVPQDRGSFKCKKDLPLAWAGLRNEHLAAASGVKDSVFCHLNLFIGAAESFEGALQMARLAIDDSN